VLDGGYLASQVKIKQVQPWHISYWTSHRLHSLTLQVIAYRVNSDMTASNLT